MITMERYCIVWQECNPNSELAHRFFVPGYDGFLPFFIWGKDLLALEQKEKVELREEQLLKGILYGLYEFDHQSNLFHRSEDRSTLLYLLDVLGNGFNFQNPEQMILDVANSLRDVNGNDASRIVLEVGKGLLPQSSKIKNDLICDLWALSSLQRDGKGLLEEIENLVPQVNLDEIHSDAKEVICYYGLCAIVLLGKEESIPMYLENYIYPNVTMNVLKKKIKALLENPASVSMNDLQIVQ
jgi:hypothetical protein